MDTRQREKEKDKEKEMAPGEGTPKVSGVADDLIGLVAGLLCGYIHSLYLFRSAYSDRTWTVVKERHREDSGHGKMCGEWVIVDRCEVLIAYCANSQTGLVDNVTGEPIVPIVPTEVRIDEVGGQQELVNEDGAESSHVGERAGLNTGQVAPAQTTARATQRTAGTAARVAQTAAQVAQIAARTVEDHATVDADQRQVREQVRSAEQDYDSFSVKPFNGNYDEELGVFINFFVTDEDTSQEQLLFSFFCDAIKSVRDCKRLYLCSRYSMQETPKDNGEGDSSADEEHPANRRRIEVILSQQSLSSDDDNDNAPVLGDLRDVLKQEFESENDSNPKHNDLRTMLNTRKSRRISTSNANNNEGPISDLRDKLNAGLCDLRIQLNRSKPTNLRRQLERAKGHSQPPAHDTSVSTDLRTLLDSKRVQTGQSQRAEKRWWPAPAIKSLTGAGDRKSQGLLDVRV
ncbi:hypothetical protein DY000_02059275 [Brassica cretica]|uniref:Uncharacterized protein n=1 Tax=Brassica cretica TaxID=69181 RepID=A0ABQ7AR92_BRACR|nr:hypothetical protein DY000_02059275 [Brassica cretica]